MAHSIPSPRDDNGGAGGVSIDKTDESVDTAKGSSASAPDVHLRNVREVKEQQRSQSEAPTAATGPLVAPQDSRMHASSPPSPGDAVLSLLGESSVGIPNVGSVGDTQNTTVEDSDDEHWLSPIARQDSDGGYSDFDWDDARPSEDLSPALQGVHAAAVEVMRRSLSLLESPGELLAGTVTRLTLGRKGVSSCPGTTGYHIVYGPL